MSDYIGSHVYVIIIYKKEEYKYDFFVDASFKAQAKTYEESKKNLILSLLSYSCMSILMWVKVHYNWNTLLV